MTVTNTPAYYGFMKQTNTLAYKDTELITAVKSFMIIVLIKILSSSLTLQANKLERFSNAKIFRLILLFPAKQKHKLV
jgi:hypothetical protein